MLPRRGLASSATGPAGMDTWGGALAPASASIVHPISMAMPADPLPGDTNMPRVAGPNFGQSQRMTLTPGKEEEGVFNMPGGQSGHPLSLFFLRGHAAWVAGKAVPLLPGPAVHTARSEK